MNLRGAKVAVTSIVCVIALIVSISVNIQNFSNSIAVSNNAGEVSLFEVGLGEDALTEGSQVATGYNTGLSFNRTVSLQPASFYEVTIPVNNSGSVDATLKAASIKVDGGVNYSMVINGETYTDQAKELSVDIKAGEKLDVKVRVENVTEAEAIANINVAFDVAQAK